MSASFVTQEQLAAAVAPLATKQDLAELRQEMKQDLAELRQEMKQEMKDTANRLVEAIRDAQTEVLRAFYNWARPVEVRLNRTDEVAQRLSWIEERIAALERGQFPSAH